MANDAPCWAIAWRGSVLCRTAQLDQAQLDVVDGERFVRLGMKSMQRRGGLFHAAACTLQHETGATADNGHVQRRFDLAQVGVERPAQVSERPVVVRRER